MNKLKRYTSFNKLKSAVVLDKTKTNHSYINIAEFKDLLDTLKKHIVPNPSKEKLKLKNEATNNK